MPENTFKTAIAAGQTQIGLWSGLSSPVAAEIAAHAGFDFILFDAEHAPVEIASLHGLLQAGGQGGTPLAARIAWNDTVMIKRALDLGVQTLMVPFVQNADEARAAAAAVCYPPHGVRGVAGATRASRYGRDKEYLATARDTTCLLVQVETGEALDQLEKIAAVDGIDGVFIGPSDLAASMGHIGNPAHEEVQAALKAGAERLKAVGMPSGILAVTATDAKRYRDWGYTFIAAGVDTVMLTRAMDTLADEIKKPT